MTRVAGVDGCRGGWAVVWVARRGELAPSVAVVDAIAPLVESGTVIAIDIPIGLPERIVGPGRAAEQAVRGLLGPRRSSVFSMPSRSAVYEASYEAACARALQTSDPPRKISRQAFNILPKVREADACVQHAPRTVFEVHAEMAFWRLNGERAMPSAKAVRGTLAREALESRIALLCRHGFARAFFQHRPRALPLADLVDAAALALIARRCANGEAEPFPDPPQVDPLGLPIAIWA